MVAQVFVYTALVGVGYSKGLAAADVGNVKRLAGKGTRSHYLPAPAIVIPHRCSPAYEPVVFIGR